MITANFITAAQARELMGKSLPEVLNEVYKSIRARAECGLSYTCIRAGLADEAYKNTELWKNAKSELVKNGFNVRLAEEVEDMYVLIEW
jgi:hypothetical protein